MAKPLCWVIDNYEFRECNHPTRDFKLPVSLHGHSYHSEEILGRMNQIMKLPVLNVIHELFNHEFRAKAHDDLNYEDLHYCPPISPEEIHAMELNNVKFMGFEDILLTITDHDKIAACHELQETRPDLIPKTSISEELTVFFNHQSIHLGVHGIPVRESEQIHSQLQMLCKKRDFDSVFDLLKATGCLVILNHPLWHLKMVGDFDSVVSIFMKRYKQFIHALEFNGLRTKSENCKVIDWARSLQLPLIGGGDRHTPIPSLVMAASFEADNFNDYIEEVKSGRGVVLGKNDYFLPHWWKLFVRILQYVEKYREIVFYKKIPLSSYPIPDRILPDFFAELSGSVTKFLTKFNLVR